MEKPHHNAEGLIQDGLVELDHRIDAISSELERKTSEYAELIHQFTTGPEAYDVQKASLAARITNLQHEIEELIKDKDVSQQALDAFADAKKEADAILQSMPTDATIQ